MIEVVLFDPNSTSHKHIHKPQVLEIIHYTSQGVISQSSHFRKVKSSSLALLPTLHSSVPGPVLVLSAWGLHLCPQFLLPAPTPFIWIPEVTMGTMGMMEMRRTMADHIPGISRIHYKGRNNPGLWHQQRFILTPLHQPRSPPPFPAGHAPYPYLGTLAK